MWTGWTRCLVYSWEMHSIHNVGALALASLNADGAAEEGAEGDAVTAFPALSHGLDMSWPRI